MENNLTSSIAGNSVMSVLEDLVTEEASVVNIKIQVNGSNSKFQQINKEIKYYVQ